MRIRLRRILLIAHTSLHRQKTRMSGRWSKIFYYFINKKLRNNSYSGCLVTLVNILRNFLNIYWEYVRSKITRKCERIEKKLIRLTIWIGELWENLCEILVNLRSVLEKFESSFEKTIFFQIRSLLTLFLNSGTLRELELCHWFTLMRYSFRKMSPDAYHHLCFSNIVRSSLTSDMTVLLHSKRFLKTTETWGMASMYVFLRVHRI